MPDTTITMPQLGETVTEGTVAQWLKRVGESVEKYEPFVEVATDKVNAEVPSPVAGRIRELIVKEGETVPTGAPIAIIESLGAANGAPMPEESPLESDLRRVSPAVRRLAREHRIDLSIVSGSGSGGRITADDVLAAAQTAPAPQASAPAPAAPPRRARRNTPPGQTIPLTQARRIMAERMVASKQSAPHAWTMVEVDMTKVVAWRNAAKDAFARDHGTHLTLLPFFLRAVVESLARFPLINAKFTPEGIYVHKEVHLGIAVALEDNLVVPVLRNADQLSIAGLANTLNALVDRARDGRLTADDLGGGTLTVNNTGAIGSVLSGPILNGGQAAIITMEAVIKRPVVVGEDAIAVRSMMNVCASIDHRVLDGVGIIGYLNEIKRRLESMGPTGTL